MIGSTTRISSSAPAAAIPARPAPMASRGPWSGVMPASSPFGGIPEADEDARAPFQRAGSRPARSHARRSPDLRAETSAVFRTSRTRCSSVDDGRVAASTRAPVERPSVGGRLAGGGAALRRASREAALERHALAVEDAAARSEAFLEARRAMRTGSRTRRTPLVPPGPSCHERRPPLSSSTVAASWRGPRVVKLRQRDQGPR